MEENRILTELPRYTEGRLKGKINYSAMVGMDLYVLYEDNTYKIKVLEHIKGKYTKSNFASPKFIVEYDEQTYNIDCSSFIIGQFGRILKIRTKSFKINIGDMFKDSKRDMIITDREYREYMRRDGKVENEKWYKYVCNRCGYEGSIMEGNLLKGRGCSCCAGQTAVLGINTIWDTDRWLCTDHGLDIGFAKTHTVGTHEKADFTCIHCGRLKEITPKTVRKRKSIGCICGDKGFSYGHKYVHSMLKQNNIDFQSNVTFDWCKFKDYKEDKIRTGEYDFVIEDTKMIIEVDGGLHRVDNTMSGQTKEKSQYIDEMKDKLAREHGYEVIRIYYDDKKVEIKKYILNSEVSSIIDISNTNWLKCEEFALKNLIKEVCDHWNNKQEWETTATLSEVFGLSKVTVKEYLKKGANMGWCEYNSEEEMIKNGKLNGKLNGKHVAMYDLDGNFIMEEYSTNELVRRFFAETGIKLYNGNISLVCLGKQKHHKGYTFKYID